VDQVLRRPSVVTKASLSCPRGHDQYHVQLDFIRPGKPVENSYIESFNGRLRDECLKVEVFFAPRTTLLSDICTWLMMGAHGEAGSQFPITAESDICVLSIFHLV